VLVVSEVALRGTSALAALAAACAVGRGMAVLLMYRQRYAREEGLGNLFIGKITLRQSLITMGIALALATLLLGSTVCGRRLSRWCWFGRWVRR
jgi:adenosylcobinamide-GDP ribazoletransferase